MVQKRDGILRCFESQPKYSILSSFSPSFTVYLSTFSSIWLMEGSGRTLPDWELRFRCRQGRLREVDGYGCGLREVNGCRRCGLREIKRCRRCGLREVNGCRLDRVNWYRGGR